MAVAQRDFKSEKKPLSAGRKTPGHGPWLGLYTAVVMAYLFLPVVVIILFGFNDPVGRFNFVFNRFTLENYRTLFENEELTLALKNSLIVASFSTVV
jgi:spermidine/putrescine transport system permease protein